MPPEFCKAYQANDIAVVAVLRLPIRETDEAACLAWLIRPYQERKRDV